MTGWFLSAAATAFTTASRAVGSKSTWFSGGKSKFAATNKLITGMAHSILDAGELRCDAIRKAAGRTLATAMVLQELNFRDFHNQFFEHREVFEEIERDGVQVES